MWFVFFMTAEFWYILRYIIIQVKENNIYKYAYLRLKKNPMIYNASFDMAPSMDMDYSDMDLILGNKEAVIVITVVLNTRCGMCVRAHQRIKKTLKDHNHDIKLVNRFLMGGDCDRETLHLIELYYEKGEDVFEKALDDWYSTLDYGLLVKKYPINKISSLATDTLLQNQNWAKKII
ncbi:MAG: hypothetical protein LUH63_09485 [Parabacteroides sp.]|nr:hypothetical protein [Parabacteroides sp.]